MSRRIPRGSSRRETGVGVEAASCPACGREFMVVRMPGRRPRYCSDQCRYNALSTRRLDASKEADRRARVDGWLWGLPRYAGDVAPHELARKLALVIRELRTPSGELVPEALARAAGRPAGLAWTDGELCGAYLSLSRAP